MFSFYKNRWIFIGISLVIILAGVVGFAVNGLNIDIDFAGGTSVVFNTKSTSATQEELAKLVRDTLKIKGSVTVQPTMDKPTEFTIKMANLTTDQSDQLIETLKAKYVPTEKDFNDFSVSSFTPAYGKQLAQESGIALFIAIVLMLVYITFRFEFLSGVSAIIALIHDTLIMISIYAIFRVSVNSSFIAVILTILGYSINNTIVVFDRVRENKKFARKETFDVIIDKSIWGTMGRSINTTLTTFIMVLCLYIIGGNSIKEFAFPLIVGLIGGAYSSIFISAPLWAMLKGNGSPKQKKQISK